VLPDGLHPRAVGAVSLSDTSTDDAVHHNFSLDRGGTMVTFADGSGRFLREPIHPKVFEGLATVAPGETSSELWDH
jgi:hypothetical protein